MLVETEGTKKFLVDTKDFDVDNNSDFPSVEDGLNYIEDNKHEEEASSKKQEAKIKNQKASETKQKAKSKNVGKGNQSCRTIDGPGKGKPCMFPFIYLGNVFKTCIKAKNTVYGCSTMNDENGKHVVGSWAACSLGCPEVKYEGYEKRTCDTEEEGIKCTLPFSYMGFQYNGCIKTIRTRGDKPWCVVKDEMAEKGFRRVNCTKSCPTDYALSEEKLSPEKIAEKLKTHPTVTSMIERGRDCWDYMAPINMTKVCLEADYCSPEKKKANKALEEICGEFTTIYRKNDIEGGDFPYKSDCMNICGNLFEWF